MEATVSTRGRLTEREGIHRVHTIRGGGYTLLDGLLEGGGYTLLEGGYIRAYIGIGGSRDASTLKST